MLYGGGDPALKGVVTPTRLAAARSGETLVARSPERVIIRSMEALEAQEHPHGRA